MTRTSAMQRRLAVAIAIAATACLAAPAALRAAITGPYTADANTLHLYHLDESGTPAADAGTGAQPMNGAINTPTFGASSFTGFGTSLDTSLNALLPANASGSVPPHRPVLAAAAALSTTDADAVNLDWAGASGSFSIEAIVKFDPSFDPASTTYRNGAAGSTGGNYPMEIVSAEGDTNGTRLFQFRINQIGSGTAANVAGGSGTTAPRLEFANLRGIVGNQSLAINLPTTGANAITNTDWFHVAVTYNGTENTANNISFYWTKVDPTNTTANLLGQGLLVADPVEGNTGFAIGDETRDAGSGAGEGESFVGKVDEVRISSVARTADQFIFSTVPEPTSCLLAMGAMMFVGTLRRRVA